MLSSTKPKNDILVYTGSEDYGNVNPSNGQTIDQPTSSTTSPSESTLNSILTELTIKYPKGVFHKSTFNPRARAAQNYNRVEDLAQAPSTMSTLEVLKNWLTQKMTFL